MFDSWVSAARTPGERVRAYSRLENAACAARLAGMYDLLAAVYAESGSIDRESWRCDNWAAVCARIGASQVITSGMANSLLTHAVTMRERLPKVGALFADGLITYLLVRTICKLTALVKDREALTAIDADLAAELAVWGVRSLDRTDADIQALVARHDPYAVRRVEESAQTNKAVVFYDGHGGAHLDATLNETDGRAVDARMDALARTVCDRDPRTHEQRRAAAQGAMGFGWDRLPCLCEHPGCDAATKPPVGGIVIHMIGREDSLDLPGSRGPRAEPEPPPAPEPDTDPGFEPPPDDTYYAYYAYEKTETDYPDDDESHSSTTESEPKSTSERPAPRMGDLTAQRRALVGESPPLLSKPLREYTLAELSAELTADPGEFCSAAPGVILGGGVIPAPLMAQAAMHATIRTLLPPGDAPPEPRYRPSRALADFVRCRDLTCRFTGCSRPATICQIDHVIPYPYGPTTASNLACLCIEHHLLKTFWPGWTYTLDPDGTAHWRDPDGYTSTTYPGSRLLFPELCEPTAPVDVRGTPPPKHAAGLTMPKRDITRKQARANRIDEERERNAPWAEQYLRDQIPPF